MRLEKVPLYQKVVLLEAVSELSAGTIGYKMVIRKEMLFVVTEGDLGLYYINSNTKVQPCG